MLKKTSLATLVLFCISSFLVSKKDFGRDIKPSEKINVDPSANFRVIPRSFCVTEDKLFLIPDYQAGTVKILSKEGDQLKFIKALGRRGVGKETFTQPMYALYSKEEGKVGILDYGVRELFIFDRFGKVDFRPIRTVKCPGFGYDMKFSGDGEQLVISGYIRDKENKPYDLYSINIKTGEIDYLLPSPQKYNLKTFEDYFLEYKQKQTMPSIGTKAFIDINGDDVFFVWEGLLRIIKFDLKSKKTENVFGHKTRNYTKPDGTELSDSYKKGEFGKTWEIQKKFSYIRNIFATPRHVFLVYETGINNENIASSYRLQTYTTDGNFLSDVRISGNPGKAMWLDKENYELYALSEGSESGNGVFTILKYKINR
jgi:energy-coupling factor transporter ATP-binding protein EcfA2